ncbi:hypothetical protein H0H81_000325 [Sphagnurus paluster]|uniref:Uncharacterized protein n=1 Tax=Sphagnurus paluster TaxID=117069 RepID=A0A9P7GMT6_9AGAR|nr:hypothetical protein H0H81_000325 [Sphagnurus paluster]
MKASGGGLSIVHVKNANQADLSVTLRKRNVTVERCAGEGATQIQRMIKIERRKPQDVIEDAARFHLHLLRRNPETPLRGLVGIELFRLDDNSWSRLGANLLRDGKVTISYDKGAIFAVVIHNSSNVDLWPYLFYMDPNHFAITKIYCPEMSSIPPLPRNGHFAIGSGTHASRASSFALTDQADFAFGFLKLLSSKPANLQMIEQNGNFSDPPTLAKETYTSDIKFMADEIWDTLSVCSNL